MPAVAILTTIRELEHIMSAAGHDDDDIVMADDILSLLADSYTTWARYGAVRGVIRLTL